MKTKTIILIVINFFIFSILFYNANKNFEHKNIEANVEKITPIKHDIKVDKPSFLDYKSLIAQIKEWEEECPDLVEVGTYGKSTKQQDLYYIRIRNKRVKEELPKILITACIHGNEPLATSTTMWYVGSILKNYNNKNIENLVDSRDLYFIPVVSPDSYPKSRIVDGVDPNRNFPGTQNLDLKSVPPVAALQEFFLQIKPKAVMSGHTYGRVYLMPPGDSMNNCPDHDEFVNVLSEMSKLSGYRHIRACDLYMGNGNVNVKPKRTYGTPHGGFNSMVPIYGTETDWYYRNGAFAIVVEFGTHQKIPTDSDISTEFDKTYEAMLYFLVNAPKVEINTNTLTTDSISPDYLMDFRDE